MLRWGPSKYLTVVPARVQLVQGMVEDACMHCVHVAPQCADTVPCANLQDLNDATRWVEQQVTVLCGCQLPCLHMPACLVTCTSLHYRAPSPLERYPPCLTRALVEHLCCPDMLPQPKREPLMSDSDAAMLTLVDLLYVCVKFMSMFLIQQVQMSESKNRWSCWHAFCGRAILAFMRHI